MRTTPTCSYIHIRVDSGRPRSKSEPEHAFRAVARRRRSAGCHIDISEGHESRNIERSRSDLVSVTLKH